MRLSQRCSCLHEVWRGNLILTILLCENQSNIWELNYRPQMSGANKLTGEMELVLRWNEWVSLFSHGTFRRFSTRFVRTSGNGLNCLTKHGATFSSLNISRCTYCSVMMNMLAIRYFFLETEESISEIDSHHICKKRLSCDRVINRGLGNLSSQARL